MNKQKVTIEGMEKLKKELDYLKNIKRKELAKRLQEAISFGDLSENFSYIQTKEEQNFLENRIFELEKIIKSAIIIKTEKQSDKIQVGSFIKVISNNQEEEFQIVGSEESDPTQNKISFQSPFGRAFLNKSVGKTVEVETPNGKISYKILEIK
jgi:transcription elongation factor GreA